mgnify:CR=1 FL=1
MSAEPFAQEARVSRSIIAIATLAAFLAVEHLHPMLLRALGGTDVLVDNVFDVFVWIYTPYWLVPLLLAAALFGLRKVPAVLGVAAPFAPALAFGALCTLPMLVGYAIYGTVDRDALSVSRMLQSSLYPGVFEEVLYRAMLFGLLFRLAGWGFLPAALIGAAHLWQGRDAMEAVGVAFATGIGAIWFAWLYAEWRDNLWVPIVFHVLMNLYWSVFQMGDNALGGHAANVFRMTTILLSIVLTVVWWRSRGGRVVVGKRWWRGAT